MAKNKLQKFSDMEGFPHVFQLSFNDLRAGAEFDMKGRWNSDFFKNNNPIVLELGCGKGEYTLGLARLFPEKNFIGIDIKGARMWTGARQSLEEGLANVAFLRTKIEMLSHFFTNDEVSEIWITFPDPQMKKTTKRMTATNFMAQYQQFVKAGGIVHLKTDSNFMYTYTRAMVAANFYPVLFETENLYQSDIVDNILNIKTYYEQQWLARGIDIRYLKFELQARYTFVEPDIEIEHDSYRSFGRTQRTNLSNEKIKASEMIL
ncbi:MAG: tRNA (guanosine(46)-N7)-methyltransferase TrmB [Prevotellaceae bacterium]|jgi:tRNA (guanine-N7-)-methyltransferase|nr:tRNA (guanosine(46)-N7)-methyltransferase TrmB [Prevotellaceae bacterium]